MRTLSLLRDAEEALRAPRDPTKAAEIDRASRWSATHEAGAHRVDQPLRIEISRVDRADQGAFLHGVRIGPEKRVSVFASAHAGDAERGTGEPELLRDRGGRFS